MINGKWIRSGCIAAAFFMAAILFFGAHEIGRVNRVPHLFHKVEHFLYYGTMALLLARGLGRRWFWVALLAVLLVGALDEWHQLYVPGRNSSVYDWMADAAGAVVAVFAYWKITSRRRSRDERDAPVKLGPGVNDRDDVTG